MRRTVKDKATCTKDPPNEPEVDRVVPFGAEKEISVKSRNKITATLGGESVRRSRHVPSHNNEVKRSGTKATSSGKLCNVTVLHYSESPPRDDPDPADHNLALETVSVDHATIIGTRGEYIDNNL